MILHHSPDVVELFERRAAEQPEAIAVVSGTHALTFAELDRRTARLAGLLRGMGARTDAVVAVCATRSIEFIVGALAILRAGAAYLPLDPVHPEARLSFMYRDAGATVLLATRDTATLLAAHAGDVVRLDDVPDRDAEAMLALSPSHREPGALAYVIYTSGSTGQPKGVGVSGGALANLVAWHQRRFEVSPTDRATQVASPGFDAAVWEIWPYLAAGASIHIPDDRVRAFPERLRDWLVDEEITIGFLPTPLAEAVLRLEWPARTRLRALLTGGDVLHVRPSPSLPFALVNNYGPTEAAVVGTSGVVDGVERGVSSAPSIGHAITNVDVHLAASDGTLAAAHAPGELLIGGAGLARGYLGRPALTAERFVPDPFSGRPGARLYRTGDLARRRALDGDIEFMGRIDQQVKIRGFRIELGEIEAVLGRHRDVAAAVVQPVQGVDDAMLVAYVVPVGDRPLADAALRDFLAVELPAYMIPVAFTRMDRLVLTANGKVDRAALPPYAPIGAGDAGGGAGSGATRALSELEERLVRAVADVLHLEHIEPDANFFSLGAHSLMAAQLIARLQGDFGITLSLRALFDAPTPARLALTIEELLLARVAEMSDDEVRVLLASDQPDPLQKS